MNSLQFYYTHKVLGISSIIQPAWVRSTYRLHDHSEKQVDCLFFCNHLNMKEGKVLIQNIAKAIDSSAYIIVEILDSHNPCVSFIPNNLLTRFQPKGFVIFGGGLAYQLFSDQVRNVHEKITRKIMIGQNQQYDIPGCVLSPINELTGSNLPEIQKKKQQAWNTLKQFF